MSITDLYLTIECHLLQDARPSEALKKMEQDFLFQQYPFDMLQKLKQTEQSPKHHPEGNVWNHTLLVVDEAAKVRNQSKNPKVFMWAALLHDIGKALTTRKRAGKITAYGHDKAGAKLANEFLSQVTSDHQLIEEVCALIRYHMQILYVINGLPFANIDDMKRDTDVSEVALFGLCDRLGRLNRNPQKEERLIQQFLNICGTAEKNQDES